MLKDARGLSLTLSDAAALNPYERSLVALRSYRGDPLARVDEALAIEPGFAAAYVTKALMLMTFFERRFSKDALAALDGWCGQSPSLRRSRAAAAPDQSPVASWRAAAASAFSRAWKSATSIPKPRPPGCALSPWPRRTAGRCTP